MVEDRPVVVEHKILQNPSVETDFIPIMVLDYLCNVLMPYVGFLLTSSDVTLYSSLGSCLYTCLALIFGMPESCKIVIFQLLPY